MDQSAYKSQKLQTLCATKELKSLKIRKPFGGTRGLQVAKVVSPLGDQGAYKYHSLWGTRGLTSHKPFGGPKRLHNSQAHWWTKGRTSRKSRKPFRGPRGLHVVRPLGTNWLTSRTPLGDQGANKSQALWGTKGLTRHKIRKLFGDQEAYK